MFFFPVDRDLPVKGIVGSVHKLKVTDRLGSDYDISETVVISELIPANDL